jgi:hypothetical protein
MDILERINNSYKMPRVNQTWELSIPGNPDSQASHSWE